MFRPPPPSAVARVLAIPELLEQILLQTFLDRQAEDDNGALTLHSSQRISKVFLQTIQDSPKLQRLMNFNFKGVLPPPKPVPDHQSVLWLLIVWCRFSNRASPYIKLHFRDNTPNRPMPRIKVTIDAGFLRHLASMEGDVYSPEFIQYRTKLWAMPCLRDEWLREEASWKKIPICSSKPDVPLQLECCIETQVRQVLNIGRRTAVWRLDGQQTLGNVYNLIENFFERIDGIREKERERILPLDKKLKCMRWARAKYQRRGRGQSMRRQEPVLRIRYDAEPQPVESRWDKVRLALGRILGRGEN